VVKKPIPVLMMLSFLLSSETLTLILVSFDERETEEVRRSEIIKAAASSNVFELCFFIYD